MFACAGYLFGTAYLPNIRLTEFLTKKPINDEVIEKSLIDREKFLRSRIVIGSAVFWIGPCVGIFLRCIRSRIELSEPACRDHSAGATTAHKVEIAWREQTPVLR